MVEVKYRKYGAYKDSGVDWLAEIPEGWEVERLASFGVFSKGGGFSKSDLKPKGHRAVLYGDIYTKYNYKIKRAVRCISEEVSRKSIKINKGDILFTGSGETKEDIGKCVLFDSDEKTFAGGDVIVYKQVKNNPHFLKYSLNSNGVINEKGKTAKGEIIVHTYGSKLRNIYIPFPPLPEQTAIANFLDNKTAKIDSAIANKEKLIALLKERKQIMIQNAVTGKTNCLNYDVNDGHENYDLQERNQSQSKIKANQTISKNHSSRQMKDSGVEWIGEIPVGWEFKSLKYILRERNERSTDGSEPILMMSQVHGLVIRSEYHEKAEVAQSVVGNKIVHTNDLVFNKLKAHLGVFFKSNIPFKGIVSPDYAVYYSNGTISDLKYLEVLFRNPAYISQFICKATGIVEGLIRLYTDDLFSLKVPVPPKTEQNAILNYIQTQSTKIDKAIALQQTQIEKLKEYKATLIDSAVTGKIKVV